ncbi:hypothetical protein JG687_00001312 [Phytophthora cactorum]|uniref:Uncharacterized protein n=1 Tax=Phytophthora cactorum TaxID=29920 RepID=A0A8T1UYC8_9STRA|nr:hypothetical protein JG687_00001312 [Phytophthora cactorum]
MGISQPLPTVVASSSGRPLVRNLDRREVDSREDPPNPQLSTSSNRLGGRPSPDGLGSAPTYVVSKRKRSSKRVDTLIKDITDMEERQERASQEITKLEDVNRRAEADSKRRLEAREESARIEWEERD